MMINPTLVGRPILHHLCHTAPSHLSKQVSEIKIEGHELETVLLTNFLTVCKNIRLHSNSFSDLAPLLEVPPPNISCENGEGDHGCA